ncbi:hypothetical protein TNIN_41581 [Trichonephila inaurata madagascariensis]|uniref:Uncharacterized protein n=1 Tax=Trichonephila inaurata madagascariensis TaxID=2747483 RepID=A0A8X6I385_9ARAC|nr:hypothetical protein TNIN_41581 [Trichonephila inaurata madagascariensis]
MLGEKKVLQDERQTSQTETVSRHRLAKKRIFTRENEKITSKSRIALQSAINSVGILLRVERTEWSSVQNDNSHLKSRRTAKTDSSPRIVAKN